MNPFVQGGILFLRKRKTSFYLMITVFLISLFLVLFELMTGIFQLFKSRNENPYSDYYRLVVDRSVDLAHEGYDTTDKMFSGYWSSIKEINSFFYDIKDYTAEVYGHTIADITAMNASWLQDDGMFLLYGITDCLELSEFSRGDISLEDGRLLTSSDRATGNNVCMISETVAKLNGVSVGSQINFQMADGSFEAFSVIGIYKNNSQTDITKAAVSYNLPDNRVFVPLTVFDKAAATGCYNYQIKVDDCYIAKIEGLVNQYAMCEGYPAYFIRVSEIFEGNNREIHLLQDAVGIIKIVAFAVSSGLMFLFVSALIRSIKHDLGLMLALGEKKCNLAASVLVEFSISAAIGILLSGVVLLVFGSDLCAFITNRLSNGTTVESLQNTTLDSIKSVENEVVAFAKLTDADFLQKGFGKALILIISSVYSGFIISAAGIFGSDVMSLLTKRELRSQL